MAIRPACTALAVRPSTAQSDSQRKSQGGQQTRTSSGAIETPLERLERRAAQWMARSERNHEVGAAIEHDKARRGGGGHIQRCAGQANATKWGSGSLSPNVLPDIQPSHSTHVVKTEGGHERLVEVRLTPVDALVHWHLSGGGTDPQLSTAKRQQRAQALNTTLFRKALEHKLAVREATRVQLETRLLPEHDATVECLEADRQWLAEREKEERVGKEHISKEHEGEKLRASVPYARNCSNRTTWTSKLHLTRSRTPHPRSSPRLRVLHDAVAAHGAEALRLQFTPNPRQPCRQTSRSTTQKRPAKLGSLCTCHAAFEVLRGLNRALERWAAGADDLRETMMHPLRRMCRRAVRAEHKAWAAHNAASEMHATTPVSITHNLPALHLRHGLLQTHGADHAVLRQRRVEVQAWEVHARVTVDALLQETWAEDDLAMRAKGAATLADYTSEEVAQGTGHVDQAKGKHVGVLEALMSEYKACMHALEAAHAGLQALHDYLTNEKHTLQEARQAALDRLKSESSWCCRRDRQWSAKKVELKLKQRNKHMLRLQQVFASKTAEFREVLSAILGAKLAFYDNGQVRSTTLVPRRRWRRGTHAGGPQELLQLMWNWVDIEQSIPCFLVSVTFECYDKWKREQ
ncbi:hypothetical protein H4582DRAFT_2061858 [Lactarius indigo]|nr:hypothetical protein H4582DRAFT_2061858 [Lactarius indigo]